jgi:hypothetical protein
MAMSTLNISTPNSNTGVSLGGMDELLPLVKQLTNPDQVSRGLFYERSKIRKKHNPNG